MKDIIKERFDFNYENDSAASFIVLNMRSNEKILEYQIEMIANNSCPGILKLDTRYKNDDIRLHYNITSKLTLSQFLQRKKLNRNEFIVMLRGITKTLLESKEYLLYDKSFLIDEDYIYINPSTLEVGMIYIPLDINTDVSEEFKSFLINLIISSAKIDEESNDNYMRKILNYLKNDVFNILDFDGLLKDLNDNESQIINVRSAEIEESDLYGLAVESRPMKQDKCILPKPKYEEFRDEEFVAYEGTNAPETSREKEINENEITVKKRYKRKYVLIAILSQILIAIFLSLSLDSVKSIAGDDISAFGGITLIVAAIDVLLFRNLFKKENMEEVMVRKEEKKIKLSHEDRESKKVKRSKNIRAKINTQPTLLQDDQNINMSKREIHNINEYGNIDKVYEQVALSSEPTDIPYTNINETVILDEEKQEFPCLKRSNKGIMDKVSIAKSNFIIGRLPDYVDYFIENNAIGRTHAEILCREEEYFIIDLNSKNGTFLNEVKLNSNKEYKLNNGDKIKFANIEYTFMVKL